MVLDHLVWLCPPSSLMFGIEEVSITSMRPCVIVCSHTVIKLVILCSKFCLIYNVCMSRKSIYIYMYAYYGVGVSCW